MRIRRLPPPPGAGAGRGGEGGGRAGGGTRRGRRTLILIRRLPPECGFGKTEQAGLALARQRRGDTKPAHPSPEGRAGGASPAGRGRRARGSGLPPPQPQSPSPWRSWAAARAFRGCVGLGGSRGIFGATQTGRRLSWPAPLWSLPAKADPRSSLGMCRTRRSAHGQMHVTDGQIFTHTCAGDGCRGRHERVQSQTAGRELSTWVPARSYAANSTSESMVHHAGG